MRNLGKLAFAGVSLLAIAAPARAQDAAGSATAPTWSGNEIVVQARRKDESAQDVPLVVQAVTAQELSKLNIRDFKDIQTLVPGLSMSVSANGIGTQSSLRGIAYDVNASGNNGTIEFYMNDAPLSSAILFQSMFDVGQIEVLRGPQGTLRGRASPSGSITVTTRKPDLSQPGGYADVTVNSIGGWDFNGAINVPVIADKMAVRVAGLVSENNFNRVRSLNNSTRPKQENRGIRASVRVDPFDNLSLFAAYTRSERKVVGFDQVESAELAEPGFTPASTVVITPRDRQAVMASVREWRQRFEVWNFQGEFRFAGQKLNYVGSVNKQRYNSVEPADVGGFFGPAFRNVMTVTGQGPYDVTGAALTTFTHGDQENHEFRISSEERVAGMFDYVVGYLWNKLDSPTELMSDTVVFGRPFPPMDFGMVPTPNNLLAFVRTPIHRGGGSVEKSFFGNITAHITEATELSGGVRRIKYHEDGVLGIGGACGLATDPACFVPAATLDRTLKATIWSASLKHRFNESLMAYVSFGSSWRPGSFTNPIMFRDNLAPTPAITSLFVMPPERSKSYEIGIKSDWFDRRLRLNITGYHQTFKNYAVVSRGLIFAGMGVGRTGPVPTVFTANPGIAVGVPAKVDGVEAELSFQATPRFNMGLVAAYSKSKIKNGVIPCNDYILPDGTAGSDGVPDRSTRVPTYAEIMSVTNGDGVAFCRSNKRAGTGAPFSMTFNSEYSHPLSDSTDAYLRGFVNYNGKSQNDPNNAIDDIKAYALVNLFLGIRDPDGAWDLGVYAKNVFDSRRVLTRNANAAVTGYRSLLGASNGVTSYRSITYSAPREFGVHARMSFGSR
ncbi:MAG: TonB-dependent receptor [Novosphingobium sp.]